MKKVRVVVGVLCVLLLGACSSSSKSTSSSSSGASSSEVAPANVVVHVGVNDPANKSVAVLQFMPASITVPVNTPVTWSWDGTIEPHSVTFLKPDQTLPAPGSDQSLFAPTLASGPIDGTAFVNSGLQPLGPTPAAPLELTFSKTGSYQYHCVIHPQMLGTVNVVDAGTAADTAQKVFDRGNSEKVQWIAEGEAAANQLAGTAATSTDNGDGTKTWTVLMGATTAHTDILAFSPVPTTMKAGDKVRFLNNSGAPHTATFSGSTPVIQDPTDPRTDAPAPGVSPQTLDLTSFFNTGLLPPDAPPGAGPPEMARTFTFATTTAGTYPFYCILHASSGMGSQFKVS